MSETVRTPEEQTHYDAVMASYDRVLLEDRMDTLEKELNSIRDELGNTNPTPDRPDLDEANDDEDQPTAVMDGSTEAGQPAPDRRPRPVAEERRRSRTRTAMAVGAAALALVGGIFIGSRLNNDDGNAKAAGIERVQPGTANSNEYAGILGKVRGLGASAKSAGDQVLASAAGSTAAHETTVAGTTRNANRLYANHDSGDNAQHLIGNFNINPKNPEQSQRNFENDLRHNPETLAYWQTCLSSGNPEYGVCTSPNNLEKATALAKKYAHMDAAKKGLIAESVISKFEAAQFAGITMNSGPYSTVGITESGQYFATTNTRENDPWLNYVFTTADGKKVHVSIRSCAQQVVKTPTTVSRPVPTPPVKVTTSVTPPESHPQAPTPTHPRPHRPVTPPTTTPKTPPTTPPVTPPEHPPVTPPQTPPEQPPKVCPPGYEGTYPNCLHPAASGPPPEAVQAPRPQPATPGYTPGNAEAVDGTQHGDPTNLDPTPHGTEVPDSQAGGRAPGGGDSSVVEQPASGAQDNPDHTPGSASNGTNSGTSNQAGSPEAQTGGSNATSGAGSDPGGFN